MKLLQPPFSLIPVTLRKCVKCIEKFLLIQWLCMTKCSVSVIYLKFLDFFTSRSRFNLPCPASILIMTLFPETHRHQDREAWWNFSCTWNVHLHPCHLMENRISRIINQWNRCNNILNFCIHTNVISQILSSCLPNFPTTPWGINTIISFFSHICSLDWASFSNWKWRGSTSPNAALPQIIIVLIDALFSAMPNVGRCVSQNIASGCLPQH